MDRKASQWWGRLTGALALLACLTTSSPAEENAGFAGTWLRVHSESEDVEEKIQSAVQGMLEKAERRRRNVSLLGDPVLVRRLEDSLERLIRAPEELVIFAQRNELHVDDGSGRISIYYLDGKEHLRQTRGGISLETVAVRRGNRVEIEQEGEEGGKIFETYALAADGNRLELAVRVEGERLEDPLVVRSVYARQN